MGNCSAINFSSLPFQTFHLLLLSFQASARSTCRVLVHVLDKNDNPPRFIQDLYKGTITESSPIGSLVLTEENMPLVIKAEDADSELNALLNYDIVEVTPRKYFHIDSTTGLNSLL